MANTPEIQWLLQVGSDFAQTLPRSAAPAFVNQFNQVIDKVRGEQQELAEIRAQQAADEDPEPDQ